MNEVTKTGPHPAYHGGDNPFQRSSLPAEVNAGTVSAEMERAIAEVQASIIIAKRFPRDEARAYEKVIQACSRPSLAQSATYAFPRGGQTVSGPSIRLAEELARCYGNIEYGIRELSRREGVSEMQAFAWDKESNVSSVQNFTVRHVRDKRGGGVELTDERDIYEVTANMGGRRLRARLLAILPPDLVEAALDQCKRTLAGGSDLPMADRIRQMVQAFGKFGVTSKQLSEHLGKSLDDALPEDIADLRQVFNSMKDGMSSASDWFGGGRHEATAVTPANDNSPRSAALQKLAEEKAQVPAQQQAGPGSTTGETGPADGPRIAGRLTYWINRATGEHREIQKGDPVPDDGETVSKANYEEYVSALSAANESAQVKPDAHTSAAQSSAYASAPSAGTGDQQDDGNDLF